MPLQEAQIVVQFAGGVETKTDRKGVMPGKLLALDNAVFTKAVSLVKRFGYDDIGLAVLGSAEPLADLVALGRRQYELVGFTDQAAYSYVDDLSAWIRAADIQSVICDHEAVAKTGTDQTLADMATKAGIAVYAWEDSRGGVYYAVYDDFTGRALVSPTVVDAGGQRPRVVTVGDFIHVYFVKTAAQEIRVWRINPNQPTAAPAQIILLTNILASAPHYDVDTDEVKAVIAWANTAGDIGVAYVHQSGQLAGADVGLPVQVAINDTAADCVAVAIDKTVENPEDRRVAVTWSDGPGGDRKYVTLDYDLAEEFSPRTLVSGFDTYRTTCVFLRDDNDAGDRQVWAVFEGLVNPGEDNAIHCYRVTSDAGAFTAPTTAPDFRFQRGLVLGGKAFFDEDSAYVVTQRDSTLYRTYFCQRIEDGLVVARWLPGLAGGTLARAHLPTVRYEDDLTFEGRAYCMASVYVTDVESPNGDVFTEKGIRRTSFDFAADDSHRSAQLGRTLYIAGGLVQAYDGERASEAGFHYGADDIDAPTLGAPVGDGLDDGTYGYVVVYENLLANGEVERGPVSPIVSIEVTGGPRRVTLTVPTYRFPSKPNARIGVYRSLDGDAAVLSRVSSLDPTTAGDVNGYVANDPTVDAVTFVDEMPDELLEAQEPLYTNGGIPSNDPTGPARIIAGGSGRLFVVDSSRPNRVYFSQQLEDGYAAEFSAELFFDVDPFGGDINGLIVMDGALVVFKESAIFIVGGDGPAANPQAGGGFSPPQLETSDVGCSSPDSLVYTPVGVMFQTAKGIYLYGRDRQVRYVGAAVEAYNSQNIVAATLIEDRTQIRFLTDSGRTLLYDYLHVDDNGIGQWSTFTNHEGQDAVLVDGEYFYLRNDGQVWTELDEDHRDNNSQIRMGLETAWLKLAGHQQGWQYLWWVTVIGEYRSEHKLRVYMAFDYEDGWTGPPIEIDPSEARVTAPYGSGVYGAGVYGGVNDTRYQFQIHIGQECEAVRFRFEDVEPTGSFGASFELTELILTGGVQRTHYSVEEARVY